MFVRLAPVAALILLMAVAACGGEIEPTPRPTYTPYPPSALFPDEAAEPIPHPLVEAYGFVEVSTPRDVFAGQAFIAYEEGSALFDAGDYRAALDSFKEALELYGKPSTVLESWIAHSYAALGEYPAAITHYTNAVEIDGDALDLTNRALTYTEIKQCGPAVQDAKAALTMEPETAPGIHSDVVANGVLAKCYAEGGNLLGTLQHIEAAIAIAEEHQSYTEAEVALLKEWRDALRAGGE